MEKVAFRNLSGGEPLFFLPPPLTRTATMLLWHMYRRRIPGTWETESSPNDCHGPIVQGKQQTLAAAALRGSTAHSGSDSRASRKIPCTASPGLASRNGLWPKGALMCFLFWRRRPLGTTRYTFGWRVQRTGATGRSDSSCKQALCRHAGYHLPQTRPLLCSLGSDPLHRGGNTTKNMYMGTWVHGNIPVCSGRCLSPPPRVHPSIQPEPRNLWECYTVVGQHPCFWPCQMFTLRLGYGCLNRTRATCG